MHMCNKRGDRQGLYLALASLALALSKSFTANGASWKNLTFPEPRGEEGHNIMATNTTQQILFLLGFNFWIFGNVATTDRMASLASFSAAITELQLKLAHDLNDIVLSHSLCSLIGQVKIGQRKPANIPQTQTTY